MGDLCMELWQEICGWGTSEQLMSIVLSLVVANGTAGEVKSSVGLLKPCTSIEKYCFRLLRTSTYKLEEQMHAKNVAGEQD